MKVIMYGTAICPDCVNDKQILLNIADIELDYRDITKDTRTLKDFLKLRDTDPMFVAVKAEGRIGIPLYILEDGTRTFEVSDFTDVETSSSCSISGGHC